MKHLISRVSAGHTPRMEFFPSSLSEMERSLESFVDKDIPQIKSYLTLENNDIPDDDDEDCIEDVTSDLETVPCCDCGDKIDIVNQACTVQAEMKRFLEQQEAGLDSTFRCIRCRDCKQCQRGAGQERMSMMQEAQQELIRESVYIDKLQGRAVAKLPFLTSPVNKLKDN